MIFIDASNKDLICGSTNIKPSSVPRTPIKNVDQRAIDRYIFSVWQTENGRKKSVTSAVAVEFMLVDTVDCAAANTPATINPAIPSGISLEINSGKI